MNALTSPDVTRSAHAGETSPKGGDRTDMERGRGLDRDQFLRLMERPTDELNLIEVDVATPQQAQLPGQTELELTATDELSEALQLDAHQADTPQISYTFESMPRTDPSLRRVIADIPPEADTSTTSLRPSALDALAKADTPPIADPETIAVEVAEKSPLGPPIADDLSDGGKAALPVPIFESPTLTGKAGQSTPIAERELSTTANSAKAPLTLPVAESLPAQAKVTASVPQHSDKAAELPQNSAPISDDKRSTDSFTTEEPELKVTEKSVDPRRAELPAKAAASMPADLSTKPQTLTPPLAPLPNVTPASNLSERLVVSLTQTAAQVSQAVPLDRLPQTVVAVALNADRATLQIDPPELGRIQLDYQFDAQGRTVVTLVPETEAARAALAERIATITQALQQSLSGAVDVNVGDMRDFAAGEGQSFGRGDDPSAEKQDLNGGHSDASGLNEGAPTDAASDALHNILNGSPSERLHILV